jgi:hypothetical protein
LQEFLPLPVNHRVTEAVEQGGLFLLIRFVNEYGASDLFFRANLWGGFCDRALPPTARADARFCSAACRARERRFRPMMDKVYARQIPAAKAAASPQFLKSH